MKKKVSSTHLKYLAIIDASVSYSVSKLCSIANVSRSGYYRFRSTPIKVNSDLETKIIKLYIESGKTYGYRRITMALKLEYGLLVNHKKVYRTMKSLGLQSIIRRKFRKRYEPSTICKNVLNRKFSSHKVGEKYATDITTIPLSYGSAHLCVILDLMNNEPVAWDLSREPNAKLTIKTLNQLKNKRNLDKSVIHSDQGTQYTNYDYINKLNEYGCIQSMSRKGNCWDNAPAESFFSHYKTEAIFLRNQKIRSIKELRRITKKYIDFYTNKRPQKRLGGIPPKMYRNQIIETS